MLTETRFFVWNSLNIDLLKGQTLINLCLVILLFYDSYYELFRRKSVRKLI